MMADLTDLERGLEQLLMRVTGEPQRGDLMFVADECTKLQKRVEELQAAQAPRPMETAPKEGERVRVIQEGVYRKASGLSEQVKYWFPLPPTPETKP